MDNRGQLCTIRHRISSAGRSYKRKVFLLEKFLYSDNEKRYHTYSYELRKKFGKKVAKVSLNAGFSCPNRDGTRGFGGCSYCSAQKSGDFAGNPQISLRTQFEIQKNQTAGKWPDTDYIAYFQAGTNTYAPLTVLRHCFEEALSLPRVVGLSISTRPDCLPYEVCDYLAELNAQTYLTVEIGLQSIHDATAARINRGHTYEDFLEGLARLSSRGIRTCVHLIDGLPGETFGMMRETAGEISTLPIQAVKIHLLHVLEDTPIAKEYRSGKLVLLQKEEYVSIVCDQLELLRPDIVIQRLTGDGDRSSLLGPFWSCNKRDVLNSIDREMVRRNSFQGCRYNL